MVFFFFFFCGLLLLDICAMLGVGCYVWLPRNSKKIWKICVDILFYCSRYLILLCCLYYFIVLKTKIDPLLQHVSR